MEARLLPPLWNANGGDPGESEVSQRGRRKDLQAGERARSTMGCCVAGRDGTGWAGQNRRGAQQGSCLWGCPSSQFREMLTFKQTSATKI